MSDLDDVLNSALRGLDDYDSIGDSQIEREAYAKACSGIEAAITHLRTSGDIRCVCEHRRVEHYDDRDGCWQIVGNHECPCAKFTAASVQR